MDDTNPLQPSGAEVILMKSYDISVRGQQYVYQEYRYDKLEDAINYVKRDRAAKSLQRSSLPRSVHGGQHACSVLGGSGWPATSGQQYAFSFVDGSIHLLAQGTSQKVSIAVSDLVAIEVSGPGTTSSNAGLAGGGFGIEGAAIGIAAASLINAVTTRTATDTFLRLASREAELYLRFTSIEPFALRMLLSAAVVRVDAMRYLGATELKCLSDEIISLKSLMNDGTLSADEFQMAKKKLLA